MILLALLFSSLSPKLQSSMTDPHDPQKYLKEGPQTEITPNIERAVSSLGGEGLDFIISAIDWIFENLKKGADRSVKDRVFRKRTADQIITDGFTTGCTDTALVFIVLCRAKEIPTKYVEAIDKRWLEEKFIKGIKGHVFAECFTKNRWYQIDPSRAVIHTRPDYSKHKILAKGLDSWDIGIKSFSDLKTKFEDFKSQQKI